MEDITGFDEQIGFWYPFKKATNLINKRNVAVKNTIQNIVKKAKKGQKLNPNQLALIAKYKRGLIARKKRGFGLFF